MTPTEDFDFDAAPSSARKLTVTTKIHASVIIFSIIVILGGALAFEIVTTQPARGAMRTLSELFTIANRPDLTDDARLAAARLLCTDRYLRDHPLAVSGEGGIIGLPRNINKNFKAWREGPHIWICPTNRIGPVYRFVFESNIWRFDGPVAILRPWGEIVRTDELPGAPAD